MQELINLYYYYCDMADNAIDTDEEIYRMYTILKRNLEKFIFDEVA